MMRMYGKSIAGIPRILVLVSLFCLIFVLLIPEAFAKDANSNLDPLRPADTSSPRDTLNSFLANMTKSIEDIRQDKRTEKTYQAFRRAIQTLDFSSTTEGDSWFVRNRRLALLYELLARIKLPPEKEIPGDSEVADGSITEWTIPSTNITIVKIAEGPRSGEFLFSPNAVQQLDAYYRQAKHLPYRPGATVGIYEEMVASDSRIQGQERKLRDLLKPVDTSNPLSTLQGFLDSVNSAYNLIMETNDKLQAKPSKISRKEARELEMKAANLLKRAGYTLDLSHVPKALRQDVSIETVLQLKEIMDRMVLPPIDAVPNTQMIAAARKEVSEFASQIGGAIRWRVPNTQFTIVEILEGERQGQFLFNSTTVKQVGNVYKKIKDLPYRQAEFGGLELEYRSPGLSPGFYEYYTSASGYLIPQAHFMGRLVDRLPDGFNRMYAGQTVWQWIGFVLCVLATVLIAYVVIMNVGRFAKLMTSPIKDWLTVLAPIIVLIVVGAVGKFVDDDLNFTGDIHAAVMTGIASVVIILLAWVVYVLFKAVAETIAATPKMRDQTSESALLRIGARVIGFMASVWIIIDGIQELGADLIPLLAGLGVGGLAVALAAQSTIANFIGSLIIFANKPIRVGDFCRFGEDPSSDWLRIGTVEEIGLISTRIRGIDRTITTIPNAEFANMHIVNLTARDQRLIRTTLQLRYETTSEQMRYILAKLRELLLGHPKVTAEPARVRFVGYADYSKDVEIFCYLRCREQNEFLAIQEDIFLRIENIIAEAGSGFAFPSQTAYLSRDAGVDTDRGKEAETRVESWRARGKLPFPEFEEEQRERLEDILDYPPKGSPDHKS